MRVVNGMVRTGFAVETAILVHRRGGLQDGSCVNGFATIHKVASGGGRPEILAGNLLSAGDLETMLVGLAPERGLRFIESRILASSSNALVWWRAPAPARMWFNTDDAKDRIGQRSGVTPQPGLVFAATDKGWMVWAVKGNSRPTLSDEIFQAPFYNVSDCGTICVGNVETPRGFNPEVADEYEAAFWGSRFTHTNVRVKRKLTLWRGGCSALWMAMLSGRYKAFPERALTPTGKMLGDVIEALAGRTARRGA